jgi:hypothetical protein
MSENDATWWVDQVHGIARGRGPHSERPNAVDVDYKNAEYEVTDVSNLTYVLEDGAWVQNEPDGG